MKSSTIRPLYSSEMLKAIGLLTIKASHLEAELSFMFAVLAGLPKAQADAIYYSTQNTKARTDSMRALIACSSLDEDSKQKAKKLLERVKNLADARNNYVHQMWDFDWMSYRRQEHALKQVIRKPAGKDAQQIKLVRLSELQQAISNYDRLLIDIATFVTAAQSKHID